MWAGLVGILDVKYKEKEYSKAAFLRWQRGSEWVRRIKGHKAHLIILSLFSIDLDKSSKNAVFESVLNKWIIYWKIGQKLNR